MSLIPNTNIIVDNFAFKKNDFVQYVYFLTHFHYDHLTGLHPTWNYGTIYASKITRNLLIDRYPAMKDMVIELAMDQEHWVFLDEKKTEGVSVKFYDANHCPGAVMILF
jgi:Cft2 family RNA processing exonuclease